uniref:Uncharacterized protein n=1 Tax=Anguilla anguilla TaxID=7936 RepID=A0A0E9Q1L1_ANGAN
MNVLPWNVPGLPSCTPQQLIKVLCNIKTVTLSGDQSHKCEYLKYLLMRQTTAFLCVHFGKSTGLFIHVCSCK